MEPTAQSRGELGLYASASRRIAESLGAWLTEDFDGAAASAPLAVELLGKAVLWKVNPVLLVPLEARQEAALVALATEPSLASPSLRTIGLKVALGRLTRVHGDLPVPAKRQDRLVDCRNGSLHVGTLPTSGDDGAEVVARQVLADALTLCDVFLISLERSTSDFYGDRLSVARDILSEQRNEVEHRVARRLFQAQDRLEAWRGHVDDEDVWLASVGELEAAAPHTLRPEDFGFEMGAISHKCPACDSDARLLGRVVVEGDVDVEGGTDGPEYYSFWRIHFYPRAFACNVCKLMLTSAQELVAARVSAADRELHEDDLGDDFSATEWAEGQYNVRD